MSCRACLVVRQIVYNAALAADLCLNTILLGQPRECCSKRAARARAAGSRTAAAFCAVLTWIGNTVFRAGRDHCTWALSDGPSISAEVWHWSLPDTSDVGNG